MESKFLKGLLIACMMMTTVLLSSCGYERIDAGCEGIKVNLYGDDKGVGDVSLVTGAVWYNPVTTAIYEYPTYVRTVDYAPFTINAKDGSEFKVDPTVSLKIIDGCYRDWETDRKSTRLNSSHSAKSRMPSSA